MANKRPPSILTMAITFTCAVIVGRTLFGTNTQNRTSTRPPLNREQTIQTQPATPPLQLGQSGEAAAAEPAQNEAAAETPALSGATTVPLGEQFVMDNWAFTFDTFEISRAVYYEDKLSESMVEGKSHLALYGTAQNLSTEKRTLLDPDALPFEISVYSGHTRLGTLKNNSAGFDSFLSAVFAPGQQREGYLPLLVEQGLDIPEDDDLQIRITHKGESPVVLILQPTKGI